MKYIRKLIILIVLACIIFTCFVFINRNTVNLNDAQALLEEDTCYKYNYEQLSDSLKELYAKLYYAFLNRITTLELHDVSKEDIDQAYKSVMYDHPEIYYVSKKYHYIDLMNIYEIRITYTYSEDECTSYNQTLSSIVEDIKETTSSYNTIEKIKYVYDYIVSNTVYKDTSNDQDMISSLIDHQSVCAGYAKAYQYLLSQLGIEASYMQGEAIEDMNTGDNNGHAWLMLHILNDYYYSDVTWADVTTADFEHTCYATFMLTDTQMTSLYTPEDHYESTQKSSFDYYKMIHCYMDGYDESVLSYALRYTISQGKDIAEIKCSDQQTYNQLINTLQTTQTLYALLYKNGHTYTKASYVSRDSLKIVEVHFYN